MARFKRFCLVLTLLVITIGSPEHAHAEDAKHLFILSGQSNMRQPLPEAFRACVGQVFGEDRVIVVTVARPSQPIRQWVKDWAPPLGVEAKPDENQGGLYDSLIKTVQKSVGDKQLASVTYIWMQGEADAKAGWGSVYKKNFLSIIDQLKADLDQENVNFVVGRINDYWLPSNDTSDGELVRQIQQELGEENAHGDWINTDDLNRGVNPWGGFSFDDGHFPPPGYRVMGQRFAHKACKLIAPNTKLDPAIFKEDFIDSADDIKSHAAINQPITGPKPDPKHAGGAAGLATLTDGRFAKPDHIAAGWIGFAPQTQPIELVLDLGETKTIDTIAINTLITSAGGAMFPKKVVYRTSEDGKTYQINSSRYNTITFYNGRKLKQMRSEGIAPQALLLLTEQRQSKKPVAARYIKVTIETGDQWVFIDEVVVNPEATR